MWSFQAWEEHSTSILPHRETALFRPSAWRLQPSWLNTITCVALYIMNAEFAGCFGTGRRVMMPLMKGGAVDPVEEIEQRIAAGKITQASLDQARSFWQERLQAGISLPNGETAILTWRDLHHVLKDGPLRADPTRIEHLLMNINEIWTADAGRRIAFSTWQEGDQQLRGYSILSPDGLIITMHITRSRSISQLQRRGTLLWKR